MSERRTYIGASETVVHYRGKYYVVQPYDDIEAAGDVLRINGKPAEPIELPHKAQPER